MSKDPLAKFKARSNAAAIETNRRLVELEVRYEEVRTALVEMLCCRKCGGTGRINALDQKIPLPTATGVYKMRECDCRKLARAALGIRDEAWPPAPEERGLYKSFEDAIEPMLNRKLASVEVHPSKMRIRFTFQDGYAQVFLAYGDCCSRSWIEHLELPPDIVGATLLAVEDSGSIKDFWVGEEHEEEIKVYQTVFKTDRGDICLEYRNSSNGYYGGNLESVDIGKGEWFTEPERAYFDEHGYPEEDRE